MAEKPESYCNFQYLNELTGNNSELVKEFVQEGLLIAQESVASISKALDERDFLEIGRICHMLKSSMKIFGSDYVETKLASLEKLTETLDDSQIRPSTLELLPILNEWKKEVEEFH